MSKEHDHELSIHWFRNGLRFHDNQPLYDACQNSSKLLPLYIIDKDAPFAQTESRKSGIIRANFILESIKEINDKLTDKGSKLIVLHGKPHEILPKIIKELNVDAIYYERESAAPVKKADQRTLEAITKSDSSTDSSSNCQIHGYDTHTLFPLDTYVAKSKGGVAPSTYGVFTKTFQNLGPPKSEIESVANIDIPPLPPTLSSSADDLCKELHGDDENEAFKVIDMKLSSTIEILEQLGYTKCQEKLQNRGKGGIDFIGGESEGVALMETMMKRTKWIWAFEKPKTSPNALSVDTTGLSPYVKHGCVSPRKFFHELTKVYATCTTPSKTLSKPPVSLHGQLMWREYNYLMAYTTPNFDAMVNNPVARQIPWDDDPVILQAWKDGQTGYPYIDAIMTQLKETGWIHHLARHSVACFLTRGDLWQSWEHGAEIFEEELIDADWSINNFNWQWLSCTAHFYQYFRCYSPVAFGKKTDKNGDYIRKWLPQFKNFPTSYIYEPWTAPIQVQKKAGVIIGKDYPEPIVDHKIISKSNMGRMKAAYNEHKAQEAVAAAATKKPSKRARTK